MANRKGRFGVNKAKNNEGSSNLLGPLDIATLALDIGGPALYEIANAPHTRNLRQNAQVDLSHVDLNAGPVRGLRRPRFGLPPRTPMGSTLDSQQAGLLFRDAQQKANELNFNTQDEAFRLQQEQQARGIENQEALINNQVDNQESMFNSTLAARELLGLRLPSKEASMEAIFANTSKDLGQIGLAKKARDIQLAQDIMRNPESYDEKDYEWARNMINGVQKRRYGGKIKRFSNA